MMRAQQGFAVAVLFVSLGQAGCMQSYQEAIKENALKQNTILAAELATNQKAPIADDGVQVVFQTGHKKAIHALSISPNGHLVASGGEDGVKIWDVASGQVLVTIPIKLEEGGTVVFNEIGSQLIVFQGSGLEKTGVNVFDVASGKFLRRIGEFGGALMNPEGRFAVVTALIPGTFQSRYESRVINVTTGQTVQALTLPDDGFFRGFQLPQTLSRDGKTLLLKWVDRDMVVGSGDTSKTKLLVWDVASTSLRTSLPFSPLFGGKGVQISPDGRYALLEGDPHISIYDLQTGQLAKTFKADGPHSVRFSPDGKLLALASAAGTAKLLEFPGGREVKTFAGSAVNFSPDGRTLVVAAAVGRTPVLHDLASGNETRLLGGGSSMNALVMAPDGRSAVAGMQGGGAKLWDLTTGKIVRSFDCPADMPVTDVAVSSLTSALAVGCRDGSAWLWDLTTGKPLQNLLRPLVFDASVTGGIRPWLSTRVSQDGRVLVMGRQDQVILWDLVSGKELRRITLPSARPNYSLRNELSRANTDSQRDAIENMISRAEILGGWILSLAMHPDGRLVGAERIAGTTWLDLGTGQQVMQESDVRDTASGTMWRTAIHELGAGLTTGEPVALDFVSPGSGLPHLTGSDGAIHVWNPQGQERASLIALGGNDFVTVTPDQYYQSSKSRLKNVSFRVGDRLYPFEQFDLRFNRPDIVLQRLGQASPETIRSYRLAYEKRLKKMGFTEQMLGKDFHLPEVEVLSKEVPVSVKTATLTLRVRASDSQYYLDRLNVFVNDVPIHGTVGLPVPNRQTKLHEQDLSVPLVPGRNKIQVSVLNQQGVESLKQTVYTASTAPAPPQEIYVVAIGVSEYKNKAYNLRYAAKDALDLAKAYQAVEQKAAHGKVHVLNLTDQKATRTDILKAKDWLKQTRPTDLAVVFAAGHGMTDEQANYYFGTYNIDPEHPATNGLPYEEFENLLDGIPALQKVLLLDTCFSGEIDKDQAIVVAKAETGGSGTVKMRAFKAGRGVAVKAEAGTRLSAETVKFQQDWFADLRRGTGAAVISSSSGDEYSLEGEQWQNGVFTYALLNGLKNGAADANQDKTITVSELQGYVIEQVKQLTQGGQNPTARRENLDYDFAVY